MFYADKVPNRDKVKGHLMPHEAKLEHYKHLNYVTTASEAARMYNRDIKTVLYAIDTGNIAALKVGGTWLVSVASLMDFWGSPHYGGCKLDQ
jgi:hypothetical protein